jgi:hypothetical protein
MNLYWCIRWGNDREGPNGSDTHFVVRAKTHRAASKITDRCLTSLPHKKVEALVHMVFELGSDASENPKEEIISGPQILNAWPMMNGYAAWQRENHTGYRWQRIKRAEKPNQPLETTRRK